MLLDNMNILRGPNYWSAKHHQLIVMNVNLNNIQYLSQTTINGTCNQLQKLFIASNAEPPAFLIKENNPEAFLAQCLAELAIGLQQAAGMPVHYYQVVAANKPGHYHIIFEYCDEEAGRYTAKQIIAVFEKCQSGEECSVAEEIATIKKIWYSNKLGPSTGSLVEEAKKRNIPIIRLDDNAYVQLGYGASQKRIEATIANTTGCLAVDKAGNKHETKRLLADALIPVPTGVIISKPESLAEAIKEVGYPLVIKPLDGNQGKGAAININTEEDAIEGFKRAQHYSKRVVVERYITGSDFRALVIDYKFIAAAKRTPAAVIGDGTHTIKELVELANKDPRRGDGHCNVLTKITLDNAVDELLMKKNYTVQTVPAKGEEVWLKSTANLSTGGTATDVTDWVHPFNRSLFERIARTIGLDICGIDIMATDLETPIVENGGAIIEVNAAPGFRMHLEPTYGKPRNVAAPVLDMLFPYGDSRIPLVAVTGTNGKTTTTRLIAGMAQQAGFTTGYTNTDGIYINKERIYKGDCSGPGSAKVVLKDSSIEFAVLECARGGILRSGLGFDQCDCAVVTNVAEDHLGLNGIDTLEQLARVKAVVPKSVKKDGYAILNADDDLVYAMKDELDCNIALFSLYADNVRIQQHCEAGGLAATFDEGYLMLREGNRLIPVELMENIPLTHGGKALFNVANVLGATLAAYVSNLSMPAIRCSLRNFVSSPQTTPGRLNFFDFGDFKVLMDYAHNPHGVKALGEFVKNIPATEKIGIVTGVGDRRNEDIIALGREAALIFDTVIIRYDDDLRGRTDLEIGSLLRAGIQSVQKNTKVLFSTGELESVDYAISLGTPDSLVVVLVDKVDKVFNHLTERQKARMPQEQKMSA
jgi:cyanophycin synthetase